MSHRNERKEKDCLNCGTIVYGKYCHVCGQENVEPKETFFGMVTHFFFDITHFDGKFFTTLKDLLLRPGFLSAEYMKGRRMSYLNPVRMYVFTSAVFFLIFFSISGSSKVVKITKGNEPLTRADRDSVIQELQKELGTTPADYSIRQQLTLLQDTTRPVTYLDMMAYDEDSVAVGTLGGKYKSNQEYDSLQSALLPGERDGWLKKQWNKKVIDLNERFKHDKGNSANEVFELVLHKLPYLLFVSLPLFALMLKLLYIRRKEFYYADHGIFSIHHYILSFILLLLVFLWSKMSEITGWGFWSVFTIITVIAWPVYLFLAMRRFYGQRGLKTFFKFLILNISAFFILVILLIFFFIFSIFQL